jgi:hypothetical protein
VIEGKWDSKTSILNVQQIKEKKKEKLKPKTVFIFYPNFIIKSVNTCQVSFLFKMKFV